MVQCATSKNEILEHYFFDNENAIGGTYKRILRHFLFLRLQEYPEDMIFQQDGATPHYSLEVRDYFVKKLANRWMGRGGSIERPPHSPYLTPCYYFLWDYVKNKVQIKSPWTKAELKTKFSSNNSDYKSKDIEKCFQKYETRLNIVVRQRGR